MLQNMVRQVLYMDRKISLGGCLNEVYEEARILAKSVLPYCPLMLLLENSTMNSYHVVVY